MNEKTRAALKLLEAMAEYTEAAEAALRNLLMAQQEIFYLDTEKSKSRRS